MVSLMVSGAHRSFQEGDGSSWNNLLLLCKIKCKEEEDIQFIGFLPGVIGEIEEECMLLIIGQELLDRGKGQLIQH